MGRTCMLGMVFAVLVLLQGCAPGYNSVVFATRSNIGLDANIGIEADTAPANLEVAISRNEGVLMPTFEGGQTVPVMASFTSDSRAFKNFFWGVKSTFATGKAAFTMSYLYGEETPTKPWNEETPTKPWNEETPTKPWNEETPTKPWNDKHNTYKPVTLENKPNPQLPFGRKVDYLEAGKVKPVLFGTDTILGIKIKWSGQTAAMPSSVNIGFKRKEAAWAPVGLKVTPEKKYEVDIPSLLATIDTDVASSGTDTGLKYVQYFATGSAANNLARRYEVREAMLKRAGFPVEKAEKAKKEEEQRDINRELIENIMKIYKDTSPENQTEILKKAKQLKLVDENVTEKKFDGQLRKRAGDLSITDNLKDLAKFASGLK